MSSLSSGGYSDGIRVSAPSPTITDDIITQNRGYGIEVAGGGPLIQGNTISYTTTEYDPRQDFGCDYLDGSGIALEGVASGATVISGNIIEHNIGRCGGGGIRVDTQEHLLLQTTLSAITRRRAKAAEFTWLKEISFPSSRT